MIAVSHHRVRLGLATGALALIAGAAGFGLGSRGAEEPSATTVGGRKILYWYDPMVPSQRFDRPGKSPFMDMELVPKFADEVDGAGGVPINAARTQSLGMRTATVQTGSLDTSVVASGAIEFNERDVAIVQARATGFVQRTYGRAPGDVIGAGAALADILVPEWAGAQIEYLAVRRTGDQPLTQAARQRLALVGMPPGVIASVERSGAVRNVVTVSSPAGGAIKTLAVRNGMTVAQGQTLAEVNGLGTVWLNAAVPESGAGLVSVGQGTQATLPAYPGESFPGRVVAILPAIQAESRTLTARIELANRGGRLRPGMFATVRFTGNGRQALLVPTEAVIRTGRRAVIMLALDRSRYQPAEVQLGREAGGQTEVIAGLAAGERIVTSGQFLIDSEASLAGIEARPISAASPKLSGSPAPAGEYQAQGRIEQITATAVTINHGPVPALKWPAMRMAFRVAQPSIIRGYKRGDQVRFRFDQTYQGPTLRTIRREPAR